VRCAAALPPGGSPAEIQGRFSVDSNYASVGFATFLFGIFSAYWAQMTSRSAWGWFFFGLFLAPIAGVVLLHKNSNELKSKRAA
jgi:hypothetical protein